MRALVRSKLFSRTFEDSSLARNIKISFYKEELAMYRLNDQLKKAGQPTISITTADDRFRQIVDLLGRDARMAFFDPDIKVIMEGFRETDFMYLVSQGACNVSVFDWQINKMRMEDIHVRSLKVCDYFGEISLVHDGVRTANVITTNYCSLLKISLVSLWELCANYPFFRKSLMAHIHLYDDQTRIFLSTILREIPYLEDCGDDTISALAFSMKIDFLENGATYYNIGDSTKCMSIIQDGTIELRTTMDNGTPIVLERLARGAILGAYAMLVEDEAQV